VAHRQVDIATVRSRFAYTAIHKGEYRARKVRPDSMFEKKRATFCRRFGGAERVSCKGDGSRSVFLR